MKHTPHDDTSKNIIQLFNRKSWKPQNDSHNIRLAPEIDGLAMLYVNNLNPKPIKMNILCWVLNKKGDVEGLIPWLTKLHTCRLLTDTSDGHWIGYFNEQKNHTFLTAPEHKIQELRSSAHYFSQACRLDGVVQEIPDHIGTQAIYSTDSFKTTQLRPIISWQLTDSGEIQAMTSISTEIDSTSILPGDSRLIVAENIEGFQYFLPHLIANQIKNNNHNMHQTLSKLNEVWNTDP